MSFLFPLYLLGAAAIGAPIAMHLRRRRTRRRTPFSSLMFLSPTAPRARQRSRLENILLLVLRCAVIALLALAFARPFFPVEAGEAGAALRRRTVLLIDVSGSMRRGGLWARAKEEARAVLRGVARGERVAVFRFDREVRRVVGFDEWAGLDPSSRAATAAERVEGLRPGWAATDLGSALVRASEAIVEDEADAERSGGEARVVLLSDVQEGGDLAALRAYEWPRRIGLEVRAVGVEAGSATNAGVQRVADQRTGAAPDAEAEPGLRVRVVNSSDAERGRFRLRWGSAEGSDPQAGEESGKAIEVHVPPGGGRVFRVPPYREASSPPSEEEGTPRAGRPARGGARLLLSGDDQPFDNQLYLAPRPPRPVRILYIGEDAEPTAAPPDGPLYYLRRAFQPTRRRSPRILARTPDRAFEGVDPGEAGLVVLTAPLAGERIEPLRAYLRSGGAILMAVRSPAMAPALARLAGARRVDVSEAAVEDYALLAGMDLEHPLLAVFADPRFGDFTGIHFWRYRRIDPADLSGARVLARFDSGDPAWIEVPVGRGSLVVMASGWRPADSQLALSSKFVPLLYSILERSVGPAERASRFFVGDAVNVSDFARPAGVSAASGGAAGPRPVRVVRPDGRVAGLPADREVFEETGAPGLYIMEWAGGGRRAFAVNVSPDESRTAPRPLGDLRQLGVRMEVSTPRISPADRARRRRRAAAVDTEKRQQAWRWLALAAIAVLLAETALAGRLTPRTGAQA